MAARRGPRPYRQIGVFLPLERLASDPNDRVMREAAVPPLDGAMDGGFLYVKDTALGSWNKYSHGGSRLSLDSSTFIVQSASTGELFFNKILERPWDPNAQESRPPLELRVSTYPGWIGDSTIDIGGNVGPHGARRKGILPHVPYFNKLRFWQELDPKEDHNVTVFSLYFEYCNGGALSGLIHAYETRLIPIPEHFVWLVAEQLFLAIVAMKFGRYPVKDDSDDASDGSDSDQGSFVQPRNWDRIYHRDLAANNVFVNYLPKGPGRVPRVGLANNAFPEIVVGDFGNSGIENDGPPTILPQSNYQPDDDDHQDDEGHLFEWEDIYSVGEILREMAMTHLSHEWALFMRPNIVQVQDANQEPTAPPYSDELIQMLQRFEFPNMDSSSVRDLGDDALATQFPSPEYVRDNLLPKAQARVAGYLSPAGKPAGYFDQMDVSWTRPAELMPFAYTMKYATDAGDGPDGGPPPAQDDNGHEGDHGDGSGDGSGTGSDGTDDGHGGGDVEMPDSPGPPEEGHDGSGEPENPGSKAGSPPASGSPAPSSSPPPPSPTPIPDEQRAMQELGKLHKWNNAKPRYELRSLEFGVPATLPLKGPP